MLPHPGCSRFPRQPIRVRCRPELEDQDQVLLVDFCDARGHGRTLVRSHGRWIPGARWTPLASTPASPGWVSEQSAFAFAANEVLTALSGRSFEREATRASGAALANGIETPADELAGRKLGVAIGKQALAP